MKQSKANRFDTLYARHQKTLKLQGKAPKTIDASRRLVHIRRGKGHKDRLVLLPDLTLAGLRELWKKHRHPTLIFPNANGSFETIRQAKSHMDRGGVQKAMKTVVTECGIKKSLHTLPSPQFCHPSP